MHAHTSVRVSKFLHTLFRNMRRRRKTRSFPSPITVVLLFGVIALSKNLDLSSLSRTLLFFQNQSLTQNSYGNTHHVSLSRDNTSLTLSPGSSHERQQETDVSTQKRLEYMGRRVAERRAIHRRIVEKQQEQTQNTQSQLPQAAREKPVKETARENAAPGTVKEGEHEKMGSKGHATDTSGAAHEKIEERSDKREDRTAQEDTKSDRDSTEAQPAKGGGSDTEQKSERKSGIEGVPAGARVHGKLAEYGGSLGGTADGMIRGQNVTRVSYTLFKIMKLFGFISIIDSPAGSHTEWMPELVERMSFDHPSFRYVGVDDGEGIERAKKAMGEIVDGEYMVSDVEKMVGNGSDVVFHWTEMDGGEGDARSRGYMQHIRKVIVAAKNGDNGYIVFGQFPRLNGPQPTYQKGKWAFEGDEKEEPFLYNEHIRGVVPMGNGRESYMPYMTFYSLRSMPMSELQV